MANYTIIIRSVFTIHFSHKLFYDNQRDWIRSGSQVSTATAIQAPFSFYYVKDSDWSTNHGYNKWNINFTGAAGVNNTAIIKTIYDPSITGYTLPKTAAFTNFSSTGGNTTNSSQYNVSSFDDGWNFYTSNWKSGATIYFPALGFRETYNKSGLLTGVGGCGSFWTSGASSTSYARYLSFYSTRVGPQYTNSRSYGFSIFPVKE